MHGSALAFSRYFLYIRFFRENALIGAPRGGLMLCIQQNDSGPMERQYSTTGEIYINLSPHTLGTKSARLNLECASSVLPFLLNSSIAKQKDILYILSLHFNLYI